MDLDLNNFSKEDVVQLLLDEKERSEKQQRLFEVLQQEASLLKHQLAQLKRMLFGSKRERFENNDHNAAQLVLFKV